MSRINKRPCKLKFVIAETTDDIPKPVYTEWFTDFAQETNPNGRVYYNEYGTEFNFDKILTFEMNSLTKQIDYNTVLVLDHYHLGNYKNGDYKISYIFPPHNNKIMIGCNRVTDVNNPKLYYSDNIGNILAYQLDYDYTNMVGYISVDRATPFNNNTTIWHKFKPINTDSTRNRIKFVSSTKVGLSDNYKEFLELKFEEVPNE